MTRHLMVIHGKPVESSDGRYIDIENPASRTTIGQVPRATEADVDSAVLSAAAAFEACRLVAPHDRRRPPVSGGHVHGGAGVPSRAGSGPRSENGPSVTPRDPANVSYRPASRRPGAPAPSRLPRYGNRRGPRSCTGCHTCRTSMPRSVSPTFLMMKNCFGAPDSESQPHAARQWREATAAASPPCPSSGSYRGCSPCPRTSSRPACRS